MLKSTNFLMRVDFEDRRVIMIGADDRWSIHAVEGPESTFRWRTLEAIDLWFGHDHGAFETVSFPDDISEVEEEGAVCALLVGRLRDSYLFGYQGVESFWGGVTTREEIAKLIDAAKSLR